MLLTVLTILTIFLAAAGQASLPTFSWLGGIRLELLPALVAYVALSVKRPVVVVGLAVLAGLSHDALSAAPFGMTMATYALTALGLWALREMLERELPWVQFGVGALVSLVTSVVAVLIIEITFVAVVKVVWVAILSAVMTVAVFFVLDYARLQLGFEE